MRARREKEGTEGKFIYHRDTEFTEFRREWEWFWISEISDFSVTP
jgi:hypothetical protein